MLFNLDKNLKQSILAEYKKEALLYQQKREMEKQQKIKEEQEYLAQLNKQEEETLQKKKEEETHRKNDQMKYYQEIINSPDKNLRKKELIIKNWGQGRSTPHQESNNIFRKEITNKYQIDYNSLTPAQRENIYMTKGQDHMNNYLTDAQNKDELYKYLKDEKFYRQKYYKDLVNSQYEEAQRINKDRYGTNDILIIERKRKKFMNENNFMPNKIYDFGKSDLLHNPIVNPENNIGYNKYINFRLNKSNIFKNYFENKNNIKNNIIDLNNSASLPIQNDEFKQSRRIMNIKSNNNLNNIISNNPENKLICESEPSTLNIKEKNNEERSIGFYNYGRFSNDNIFDYRKKINQFNKNNSLKNLYELNNSFDHIANDQISSNGSILSKAAKSNFLI